MNIKVGEKIICPECQGRGTIWDGPCNSDRSYCHDCGGVGYHMKEYENIKVTKTTYEKVELKVKKEDVTTALNKVGFGLPNGTEIEK